MGSRLTEVKYVILFIYVEALEGNNLYFVGCDMCKLCVVRGEGNAYNWGTLVGHRRGNIRISGQ